MEEVTLLIRSTCKKLSLSSDLLEELLQSFKLIRNPLSKLILSNLLLLRHYFISSTPSSHDSSIILEMLKDLHNSILYSKEPNIESIAKQQQEQAAKHPPKPRPSQIEDVTLIIPSHRLQLDIKDETKEYIS